MQTRKGNFLTIGQLGLLVGAGIILGNGLIFLDRHHFFLQAFQENVLLSTPEVRKITPPVYSKNIFYCTSICYKPPEHTEVRPRSVVTNKGLPVARVGRNQPGTTRVADIPRDPKNPNAIRISLAEAPAILSKVRKVNGKSLCGKKNDKGRKSKKFSKPHIDQQCCLDPDEIPNPRCLY